MEKDWPGSFVLPYGWNNEDVRWDFFFLFNPLGSYEQSKFFDSSRSSKLFITSQWIGVEKKCTVRLHYFIKRIRQNCQNSHFPFLLLVSFCKFLNLKNRWCDDITWLLSTILMKHHRGEYFGKISHPHRVWKVYKQRFSEISKGISHMENHNKYARHDWRENWRNVAEKTSNSLTQTDLYSTKIGDMLWRYSWLESNNVQYTGRTKVWNFSLYIYRDVQ